MTDKNRRNELSSRELMQPVLLGDETPSNDRSGRRGLSTTRRQLLHAFAGMALGASALVRAASFPRVRDDKSVAIIAIGNPGTYTVLSVLEKLTVPIPNIAVGTSRVNLDYVRTDFDRVHWIDSEYLSGYDELIPLPPLYESLWEEFRAKLPKERTWLVVGSLSGETGSVLIPLISREASQSGRRAHVFALSPCSLESKSSLELAERTRLEVERWAAHCLVVPNTFWINVEDAASKDYFEELDRKCLIWVMAFIDEAGLTDSTR